MKISWRNSSIAAAIFLAALGWVAWPRTAKVSRMTRLRIEGVKTVQLLTALESFEQSVNVNAISLPRYIAEYAKLNETELLFKDPDTGLFYDWLILPAKAPNDWHVRFIIAAPRPVIVDSKRIRLAAFPGTGFDLFEESAFQERLAKECVSVISLSAPTR